MPAKGHLASTAAQKNKRNNTRAPALAIGAIFLVVRILRTENQINATLENQNSEADKAAFEYVESQCAKGRLGKGSF